ncbi:XRE family transcriptional regulator [Lacticaseibacillus paracasei]|uniref:XRE family transcriptional regulator n=1 Tax=Lacticaseibacillus paracasei TaxID=1597 RepID=UPI000A1DCE56|nr:XRE family transcriptional regulator [Lacticaseibacillus paracasei]OSP84404.1 XRE family transcriptional regulator [Lacticaseibacillus paracasei]
MKLRDKIQALLDSDATSYAIAKETGISNSTIVELRHGKRKLSNITLKVAEQLEKYYDQRLI